MVFCPIRRMLVRSIQMPLSQYLPKAIIGEQTQIRHSGLLSPALCVDTHDLLVPTFGHPLGGRKLVLGKSSGMLKQLIPYFM